MLDSTQPAGLVTTVVALLMAVAGPGCKADLACPDDGCHADPDGGVGDPDATAPSPDAGGESDAGADAGADASAGELTLTVTANPTRVDVGSTTTVTWSVANAMACETRRGTNEWRLLDPGTESGERILTLYEEGETIFRIRCTDADGNVQIRGATVTASCDYVPLSGITRDWSEVFPSEWPQNTTNILNVGIPSPGKNAGLADPDDAYLSMRFYTGEVIDDGAVVSIENTSNDGVRSGTISLCPGDYTNRVPEECRHAWGNGGSIQWSTKADAGPGVCVLEPNTTYYLNITFTNGIDPESSTCTSLCDFCTNCTTTLNHSNSGA